MTPSWERNEGEKLDCGRSDLELSPPQSSVEMNEITVMLTTLLTASLVPQMLLCIPAQSFNGVFLLPVAQVKNHGNTVESF